MGRVPSDIKDRANQVQDKYNRTVEAVRANQDLTAEARRRHMARAFTEARDELAGLRSSWGTGVQDTTASLTQQVFGTKGVAGVDAISLRDADDRVSRISSPSEAARLLRQAEQNDDGVLARAVARHAFDQRQDFFTGTEWAGVVDTYTANRPEVAEKLTQVADLSAQQVQSTFHDEGNFVVFKPTELQQFGDHSVRQIAESA